MKYKVALLYRRTERRLFFILCPRRRMHGKALVPFDHSGRSRLNLASPVGSNSVILCDIRALLYTLYFILGSDSVSATLYFILHTGKRLCDTLCVVLCVLGLAADPPMLDRYAYYTCYTCYTYYTYYTYYIYYARFADAPLPAPPLPCTPRSYRT